MVLKDIFYILSFERKFRSYLTFLAALFFSASNFAFLSTVKIKTLARSFSVCWPTNFFYEKLSQAKKREGKDNHPYFCIPRRKCVSWCTIRVGEQVYKSARRRRTLELTKLTLAPEAHTSKPMAISSWRDKFRDIFR